MSMSMASIEQKIAFDSNISVTPGTEPCKDLRVSNKETDDRSKIEFNFLDCFKGSSSEASDLLTKAGKKEDKKRTYNCKYCNSKFSNLQALGGHQNAHKRERALAKNSMNATAAAWKEIDSLLNPYWRMARKPYGSLNKTLGVQMQSMIYKPYNHWLSSALGHGYQGWPRATNLNPQAAAMHQTQDTGFPGLARSGLVDVLNPVEMASLNSANQHVTDMVTRGNYNKGTYSSKNQQNGTLGVDLSLKL